VSATPEFAHTHLAKSAHQYAGCPPLPVQLDSKAFPPKLLVEHAFFPMLAAASAAMVDPVAADAAGDDATNHAGPMSATTSVTIDHRRARMRASSQERSRPYDRT